MIFEASSSRLTERGEEASKFFSHLLRGGKRKSKWQRMSPGSFLPWNMLKQGLTDRTIDCSERLCPLDNTRARRKHGLVVEVDPGVSSYQVQVQLVVVVHVAQQVQPPGAMTTALADVQVAPTLPVKRSIVYSSFHPGSICVYCARVLSREQNRTESSRS